MTSVFYQIFMRCDQVVYSSKPIILKWAHLIKWVMLYQTLQCLYHNICVITWGWWYHEVSLWGWELCQVSFWVKNCARRHNLVSKVQVNFITHSVWSKYLAMLFLYYPFFLSYSTTKDVLLLQQIIYLSVIVLASLQLGVNPMEED